MSESIRWLLIGHVAAGTIALAVFLIPLLSKKGGKLHVRTGWLYTGAMIFVGLSALAITPWRLFLDPAKTTASEAFAVFLFYIAIFTLSALAFGLTTLKAKQRKNSSRAPIHLGPPMITIILGLGVQVFGFIHGNTLLMAFPFIGHVTAMGQLRYWLKVPQEKMHWWYAHMNGMFVACIATITAFLVTAVPRLWPGAIPDSLWLWIAPGLILGTVLNRWTAFYQSKFEAQKD